MAPVGYIPDDEIVKASPMAGMLGSGAAVMGYLKIRIKCKYLICN